MFEENLWVVFFLAVVLAAVIIYSLVGVRIWNRDHPRVPMTKEEIAQSYCDAITENRCPACHVSGKLLMGPTAGINVYLDCENCGQMWNVVAANGVVFYVQDLGKHPGFVPDNNIVTP